MLSKANNTSSLLDLSTPVEDEFTKLARRNSGSFAVDDPFAAPAPAHKFKSSPAKTETDFFAVSKSFECCCIYDICACLYYYIYVNLLIK